MGYGGRTFSIDVPSSTNNYSSSSGGIPTPTETKRSRTLTTAFQQERLNALLAETAFPTTQQRNALAEEIGMSPRRVQIWFQNRRQTYKRKQEEERLSAGPESYGTSSLRRQPSLAQISSPSGSSRSSGSPPTFFASPREARQRDSFSGSSAGSGLFDLPQYETGRGIKRPGSSLSYSQYRDSYAPELDSPATPSGTFSPYSSVSSAYPSTPIGPMISSLRKSGSAYDMHGSGSSLLPPIGGNSAYSYPLDSSTSSRYPPFSNTGNLQRYPSFSGGNSLGSLSLSDSFGRDSRRSSMVGGSGIRLPPVSSLIDEVDAMASARNERRLSRGYSGSIRTTNSFF